LGSEIHYGRDVGFGARKYCLDAGDVDSDGSVLFMWECNGFPQQQFHLDWEVDNWDSEIYEGQLVFPNGKCLDGTTVQSGDTPMVWECNGMYQQTWQICHYNWDHYNDPQGTGPCIGNKAATI